MAVDFKKKEYLDALPEWQLVDKVCDEKDLGALLPILNKHDKSPENAERNEQYRDRASWFGATGITEAGLVGVAFDDEPRIELPSKLEYLLSNADGEGVDLQQQAQASVGQVLRKGRAGLFVTYPKTGAGASVKDQQSGRALATIHLIDAKRIINWWTVTDGAEVKLGGVVFTDTETTVSDFETETGEVIRALTLEDGLYVDAVWRQGDTGGWSEDRSEPLDGKGQRWNTIPFTFIGAVDNSSRIDRPPLLSLARVNQDHYRNSADNEEGTWYAGQAQPYLDPGQDVAQLAGAIKEAKEKGFYVGSREVIIGKFGFAQADPNTAARQAMLDKVEVMRAMGARFLQVGTVAKTAQQDAGEQKVQHSILSLIVQNVEDAYSKALEWAGQWMNSEAGTIAMYRGFMDPAVNSDMMTRIIELYDRALVGPDEIAPVLKRAKLLDDDKTAEEYAEEVEARGGMIGGRSDVAEN